MIVDAKPPVHHSFDLPTDAPPAYDDIGPASSGQVVFSGPPPPPPPRNTSLLRPRTLRSAPPTGPRGISNTTSPSAPFLPDKSLSIERPPPARRDKLEPGPLTPKTQADVCETVCGLIRDVVQGSSSVRSSALDAIAVLDSCAAACASHQLSLARILQEKSIEGHAPLYWAIVSRPISNEGPRKGDHREDDAFLVSLITRASPLRPIAVSELRSACLVASSNALFQRLRSVHGVTSISGTDRMLLANTNASLPSHVGRSSQGKKSEKQGGKEASFIFGDIAELREGGKSSDAEWFGVELKFKIFQRRMRVSGNVSVEFIARGRLWQLLFFVVPPLPSKDSPPKSNSSSTPSTPSNVPRAAIDAAHALSVPPGSWALCLALLEGSAQCYAEARLLVNEPSSDSSNVWRERDSPPAPGRSHSGSNTPTLGATLQHPRQSSEPQQQRSSMFSSLFTRRSGSDNTQPKSHQPRPPIMISFSSVGSSPLLALPPLSSYFAQLASPEPFPDEVDLSINPETKTRPSREEKRAARKEVKKEHRAECGKETRKEKEERARVAETVLVAGLEEVPYDMKKSKNKENTAGWSKGGELMYDGCPFISPDGTLNAILEARLLLLA